MPEHDQRLVRYCVPERSALVLGSAQRENVVDHAMAESLGIDIVKRRSGGGAVLVEPDDLLWVDLFVPTKDPLWRADVGEAFWWLGDVWTEVLRRLTAFDVQAYQGPLVTSEWSRLVCFAGLGPGEVTVNGRKLVGISQRRTRAGALFQCALFRRFRVERLASLLDLDDDRRLELVDFLRQTVVTSVDFDEKALVTALDRELERT